MVMLIFVTLIAKFWWLFIILLFLSTAPYVMQFVQPAQPEEPAEKEHFENMKFDMGGTMMSLDDFPPRYRKQIEEQLRKERR